jgi:hypothetical protein
VVQEDPVVVLTYVEGCINGSRKGDIGPKIAKTVKRILYVIGWHDSHSTFHEACSTAVPTYIVIIDSRHNFCSILVRLQFGAPGARLGFLEHRR